ncbi:VWA domain-containing protein [Actinoallomurus sp. NPDC052274]|uniref:VWA domain-containing protein n=1 Tax=Actinoallomurus sp. NPDC052274 TaxID=3155420 RepID=UPI00341787D5
MSAHLITTRPEPTTASGAWLKLSAAFTDQITHLTGREDLTVTCAPGAGLGSPGCFIPALATIELDGTHLGHNPATCNPRRPSDRERYPALWGVFVHEAAHARHSTWTTTLSEAPTAHAEAAKILEESRIEAAQVRRRPADRRWLRASTRQLILADFTTPPAAPPSTSGAATTPAGAHAITRATPAADTSGTAARSAETAGVPQVAMTPWQAGRAAALLLARADADVLDADEVTALRATITEVIGASRLGALAALWHIAHSTADDDATTMLELGRRWCTILGTDPDAPPPSPDDERGKEDGESSRPSPLAAAITAALVAIAAADAPPALPSGPAKAKERREENDARQRAERAARAVFGEPGGDGLGSGGRTQITGTRPPTTAEQGAARQLARHLKTAAHRERVTITTTSATPPGRLRMRGALAADAQRAAGATPTAEPFTRTTRRHVPTPPLRVAIACDVSGSMRKFAAPVASAAWILARATAHIPDARSATVIFGNHVRPLTHPGRTPRQVSEFSASDRTERFCHAIDALDAALDLTRPGAARLLVIVSDGLFKGDELPDGQQRITRLTRAGCAVLWLTPDKTSHPMDGAHVVTLTDPAETAATIGRAAARALAAT